LDNKFDCVLSLEVGEHIPKEYESVFIDNVCSHTNNLLIISWAVVGQGGDGHINCQNNEYVINQIESRGLLYNPLKSKELRESATIGWFKNTIMVFYKK
jgi:tryptophanyl-tRNA synthetase